MTFLLCYAAVYALAAFAWPWLGAAALAVGLWMVVAVNRAWVWNEKERSKIAKKIDPDAEATVAAPPAKAPQISSKPRGWYAPTPPAGTPN